MDDSYWTKGKLISMAIIGVGIILLVTVVATSLLVANEKATQKLQICVEAGGSWDNGSMDCVMPGVELNG